MFSLGVSLYEALTGVRPFVRDSDLAVLKAVLEGSYEPIRLLRPDLPLEVESIVTRAMAVDREHRFATALELSTAIDTFLSSGTSSGGARVLGEFMRATFGEERTNSKLRIETLDELVSRGVDVPGRENPTTPKTDPGAVALVVPDVPPLVADGTQAIGLPKAVVQQRRQRSGTFVIGVMAALAVGIGGTWALMSRPVAAVVADAGVIVAPVVPVVDAGVTVAPPDAAVIELVDAGAPAVDAGLRVPAPTPAPPPSRPISLTAGIVSRGISQAKGRIQACFKDHQADLPSRKGVMVVKFAIASTGKVTEVTTDLPNTGVSRCIEGVVKGISYPRHVDQEVRVPIQLDYDVSSP